MTDIVLDVFGFVVCVSEDVGEGYSVAQTNVVPVDEGSERLSNLIRVTYPKPQNNYASPEVRHRSLK